MIDVRRYSEEGWNLEKGNIPTEMAVKLTVNGDPWLEFMCTPEDLKELAMGFLINEGQIDKLGDVVQLRVCPTRDNVDVWTIRALQKPVRWRTTSGCSGGVSIIGKDSEINEKNIPDPPYSLPFQFDEISLSAKQINDLVYLLYGAQKLHHESGGIHASALSDGHSIISFCEDIGRHNTLDKLAGRVWLEKITQPIRVILTTGRISSEMMQKAARMRTPFIISLTAPTSLAVAMAEQWDVTLIGYAHGKNFRVYAHPERIRL